MIVQFESEIILPKIGDKIYSGMRDEYEWTVCDVGYHFDVITRTNKVTGIVRKYKSITVIGKRNGNKKNFAYTSFNNNNMVKDLESLREFNINKQNK